MNNIIIAIVAWYIAEGCGLMQKVKHWLQLHGYLRLSRIKPFDCPMCMAFWMGLFIQYNGSVSFGFSPIDAVLCSSGAILISKVYVRL